MTYYDAIVLTHTALHRCMSVLPRRDKKYMLNLAFWSQFPTRLAEGPDLFLLMFIS
jgi:hypothetical protein